ncbi:GFA family protein [Mesorhizobium captivum]|uniref:GFA family protein n=1 Tax=Mesorhizobium captivum TaxID=3072319 RepID=UPI003D31F0F0
MTGRAAKAGSVRPDGRVAAPQAGLRRKPGIFDGSWHGESMAKKKSRQALSAIAVASRAESACGQEGLVMSSEHSKTEALSMEHTSTIRGRCMCGDIRYEIIGPMFDVVHCHCESCRRHGSSAFATFFSIDRNHFRHARGTPVIYESSHGVERTHCGRCGSPISYENAREFSIFALHAGRSDTGEAAGTYHGRRDAPLA